MEKFVDLLNNLRHWASVVKNEIITSSSDLNTKNRKSVLIIVKINIHRRKVFPQIYDWNKITILIIYKINMSWDYKFWQPILISQK